MKGEHKNTQWPPVWLVLLTLLVGIFFYVLAGYRNAHGAQVNTNRYHVPLWVDPYPGATGYVWFVDTSNALTSASNSVIVSNLTLAPHRLTVLAVLTNGWTTYNAGPAPMRVLTLRSATNLAGPWPLMTNTVFIDPTNSGTFLRLSNYDAVTDYQKD